MQNKRYQIKPALILCGVLAAIILVIFVMAGNINRNVVKNMKGRLLYEELSADGSSEVLMYDFDGKKSVAVSAAAGCSNGANAVFAGKDRVAFTSTQDGQSNVLIYDITDGRTSTLISSPDTAFLALDYCALTDRLVCLCADGEKWWLEELSPDGGQEISSGEAIFESDNEIYGAAYAKSGDGVYIVHDNGQKGVLKLVSLKDNSQTTLYVSEEEQLAGISVLEDTVLVKCLEDRAVIKKYNAARRRLDALRFNSKEHECIAAVAVSDTQFIVSSNAGGKFGIYVCNGSNMVKVEEIRSEKDMIVSDYVSE